MKVSTALRLGVAIAGLLIGGSALAQGPGRAGRDGRTGIWRGIRPPMERALGPQGNQGRWWNNPAEWLKQLKLTDEQRKSMDEIFYQHREKLVDLAGRSAEGGAGDGAADAQRPAQRGEDSGADRQVAQARAELEKGNAHFLMDIRNN